MAPARAEREAQMQSSQFEHEPQAEGGVAFDDVPTSELVGNVLDDVKEMARLELALAKEDMTRQAAAVLSAGIFGAMAMVGFAVGLAMLSVGLVLAVGGAPWVAVATALGFLAMGGITFGLGLARLPKALLERTRKRIEMDGIALKGPIG
jgi:hypothetical protein